MALIHDLAGKVQQAFPAAKLSLTEPVHEDGYWFLDIVHCGQGLVVQWSRGGPFGLASMGGRGYGEKADEVYPRHEEAEARIFQLLRTGSRTEPPPEVTLRELRAERNFSLAQFAKLLGIESPTISTVERHAPHMLVSTLNQLIRAMGGKLVVQAVFKDGAVRQLRIDNEAEEPEPVAK